VKSTFHQIAATLAGQELKAVSVEGQAQSAREYPNRPGKEECMYLLLWIFIGVLVGWGAGRILVGNSYGPFMDIALGVAGAVGGGYFMRSAGFQGSGAIIATTVVAVLGAAVLPIVVGLVNGRRVHVRQF
jgi:uncharacterized membrane protein YeaQ/YmgE (transglycosylase-associated protein family)